MKSITHFQVGNGNCSMIQADNFLMIIDLYSHQDGTSSYELLKPFFRKRDGKDCIDVLCISHGDGDHCGGFDEFKEQIDSGELVIGAIWHQGYDRGDDESLPTGYKKLRKEIQRREKITRPKFGDLLQEPKAKDTEQDLSNGITFPDNFEINVLSPFEGDNENSSYDHNDLSLVLNILFEDQQTLFAADSSSKYWQDKIIPELLDVKGYRNCAKAQDLIASHHGSYTFFGKDRDEVREAEDGPDNYGALDKINPAKLIISAKDKFPLNGDSSGELPPHYAARKWYHKWFVENRGVKEDEKHPDAFYYTSEGDIRFEHENGEWSEINDDDWKKGTNSKNSINRPTTKFA